MGVDFQWFLWVTGDGVHAGLQSIQVVPGCIQSQSVQVVLELPMHG